MLHPHTEPRPRLMLPFQCRADRGPIISRFHGSYDGASREAILQPLVFLFILCAGQRRHSSFPRACELTGLLKHHNSAAPSLQASCTCTAMQQLIDNHCLPLKVKHAPPDDRRPLGCRLFFSAVQFHGFLFKWYSHPTPPLPPLYNSFIIRSNINVKKITNLPFLGTIKIYLLIFTCPVIRAGH